MKGTPRKTGSVKMSISLSPKVWQWANDLAEKRGFGTNFSAFIADLVRHNYEAIGSDKIRVASALAAAAALHETGATGSPPAPVGPPGGRVQYPKAPRRPRKTPAKTANA